MTRFTIASFNVKNLIGAEKEYYKFQKYTPEEFAWKLDWTADQLLTMNADVVGFQEIFEEEALSAVVTEASSRANALNTASVPDKSKRYHRKAIFRKLKVEPYTEAALAFAPNAADTGQPGERRPGLAVLSRLGFVGEPVILQDLPEPLRIPFQPLRGLEATDAGHYELRRISRPILKVRVPVGGRTVTVFNCHLKSKLGEYDRPEGAPYPTEADLTQYDPLGRAMGSLRAAVRRMAEAWVLRQAVVEELRQNRPVIVLGDFNDGENAVSTEIITGERPFRNYAWMLRHDAKTESDRYTKAENTQISDEIAALRLHSAERLFVRKSARDMIYTSAFGGNFQSIDQIFLSAHFHPDTPNPIGGLQYFSAFNDHLTDGSHPEAPYNKLASDHGQIMAHLNVRDG